MKSKKFPIAMAFLSAAAIASVAAFNTTGLIGAWADNVEGIETWHHYEGSDATAFKKGVKEYWVNCGTHAHQFTAPTDEGITIVDKGTPTQDWINALDASDDRLIAKFPKIIDFEDEDYSLFTPHASTTAFDIADGEGIDGSKALHLSCIDGNAAVNANISKAYLDAVFVKSEVKAVSFAAKANVVAGTFQSRKGGSYESVDVANNGRLQTYYKTFYLTRPAYEAMTSGNDFMFLQAGASGLTDVYLDNFRVSYFDITGDTRTGINMDSGGLCVATASQQWYLRDGKNNQADLAIRADTTSILSSVEFDHENRSTGVASIQFNKVASGGIGFTLNNNTTANLRMDHLPDEGIYMDFYAPTSSGINITWTRQDGEGNFYYQKGALMDGRSSADIIWYDMSQIASPVKDRGHGVSGGRWVTFHLPKSVIQSGRFMQLSGGTTGKFNIDNIRLANGPLESFEQAHAFSFPNYRSDNGFCGATCYKAGTADSDMSLIDSKQNYLFESEWKRCSSAEISDEHASEGDYSLKLNLTNETPFRMSPSYEAMLYKDGGTITFDVYSDDLASNKLSMTTLGGNVKTITKGEWSTITLTADDFKNSSGVWHNSGRFTEKAFGAGTVYIDNIRWNPA